MLTLTPENYHSIEANREYVSVSQYLGFLPEAGGCEAQEMAKLDPVNPYIEPENKALLVGSYTHVHFEGGLPKWITEHPGCFTQKLQLRAEYIQANDMIARLEADPFCMFMLQGQSEVIITAELFGARWKIKIDKYKPEDGRMVDLKTCKSIWEREWNKDERRWESWVEHWGYVTRTAIYLEVERLAVARSSWLNPYIVAVSKETPPDIGVISMLRDDLDYNRMIDELRQVEVNLPRILAVKSGQEKPRRCERCAYCRQTRVLGGEIIHWRDL